MHSIGSMFQSGREIKEEELADIEETVRLCCSLSRVELARTICEHLGWLTAGGGYKQDACLKLLDRLEASGRVKLPEKRGHSGPKEAVSEFTARTERKEEVCGRVRDIAPVRVELVVNREQKSLFCEYLSRYHYLGYSYPFGYSMGYFIESTKGLLGCLLFQGAAKALRVRDEWIGWSKGERLRNLAWVVNNSRFLIFPWVKVKNLGSYSLGHVLRRLGDDWDARWRYRPVLVESFVDPQRYEGSSYKGANWQYLGMTTGRGLARKGKKYSSTPKKVFVRALTVDFRALLCSEQPNGEAL